MKRILDKLKIDIEVINDKVLLYKDNKLHKVLTNSEGVRTFNYVYEWSTCIKKIRIRGNKFVVVGCVFVPHLTNELKKCYFVIGDNYYSVNFKKCGLDKSRGYYVEFETVINVSDMDISAKTQGIYFKYEDERGVLQLRFNWDYYELGDSIHEHKRRKIKFSKCITTGKHVNFFYQTNNNFITFSSREKNVTDDVRVRFKLKVAKVVAKIMRVFKFPQKVIFFEKFCERYEESAAILFDYCISRGIKNVAYIIDKDLGQYEKIPAEYRKHVINKFSFKHFLYFYFSNTFIATESMNHIIELNIYNSDVRKRINDSKYNYIFLQHGVMYMYCLKNRGTFIKGDGMPMNARIVVSSKTEANHIIEDGKFLPGDMIYSGLPKFDKAFRYDYADSIVIMPTSRDFEYNIIKNKTESSRYYVFANSIINEIPEYLKQKVVFIPHPLIKEYFKDTPLYKYVPEDFSYEDVLRTVKLLITDYSSISYDAFYRGSNVLFCWHDKDYCLSKMNYTLMLNDENVFGDVCYEYSDLKELIIKNYHSEQSSIYKEKYSNIVEFNDNNNTLRCFEALDNSGVFKRNDKRQKLEKSMIYGVGNKVYTGHKVTHRKKYVLFNDKVLTEGVDYRFFYIKCKRPGSGLILLKGIGAFKGFVFKRYKIKKSIKAANIGIVNFSNDENNAIVLDITMNGQVLKPMNDYIVEVDDMGDGIYEVLVKGRGEYGGLKKLYFSSSRAGA